MRKPLEPLTASEEFSGVLAAAKRGEADALAELYRRTQPRLLGYLRLRHADAEDLASETWLDVAAGLARFQGNETNFAAWVFTIARRRLIDDRRRAARQQTFPATHEDLLAHGKLGDVEEEAMVGLSSEEAIAAISGLSPDQADVVLLRVIGGFGVEEVATILGKRPGAIRALQLRALRTLARTISSQAVTE